MFVVQKPPLKKLNRRRRKKHANTKNIIEQLSLKQFLIVAIQRISICSSLLNRKTQLS